MRKNWEFPEDFPSFEVIQAYRNPMVDENTENFYHDNIPVTNSKQKSKEVEEEVKDIEPDFKELRAYIDKSLNWSQTDINQYVI